MAPILYLILQVLLRFRLVSMAGLRIDLTAPINPVEEGNMLSIHCKIYGLSVTGHTVFMYRNVNGEDVRIAMDSTMLEEGGADERFFLANRRLQDNTMVYFLSIIDITREDEGIYRCEVRDEKTLEKLEDEQVTVLFKYFPDDIYPICSPSDIPGGITMYEDQRMTLNCSSELGNPEVTMEWTKEDQTIDATARGPNGAGLAFAELTFTTTLSDDKAIYICKIKSIAFPDDQRSCHVGPFNILEDPNKPVKTHTTLPPSTGHKRPPLDKGSTEDQGPNQSPGETRQSSKGDSGGPTYITTECSDVCEENILYWVLATIIAGTLAIVFCIIGIVIFVRYRRRRKEENKKKENTRNSHYQNREAIYAEVETRGDGEGVGGGGGGDEAGGGVRGEPQGTILVQRGPPGPDGTIQVQRIVRRTGTPGAADENKLYMALDTSSYISTIDTSRALPESEPLYNQNQPTSSTMSTTPVVEDPYSTRNVTHTTFGL